MPDSAALKILFVENHIRFAAVTVKAFLSSHQVTVVPSIQGAHEFLTAERFDVVLVDYDLEDGKGDELLSHLQTYPTRPIVIAVSSHAPGNQALLQAGADATCSKMDFKNIEAVIATAHSTKPS